MVDILMNPVHPGAGPRKGADRPGVHVLYFPPVTIPIEVKIRNGRDSQSEVMLQIVIKTNRITSRNEKNKQKSVYPRKCTEYNKAGFQHQSAKEKNSDQSFRQLSFHPIVFKMITNSVLTCPAPVLYYTKHNSREQHAAVFYCHKTVIEFPPRLYLGWKQYSLLGEGGESLFPLQKSFILYSKRKLNVRELD